MNGDGKRARTRFTSLLEVAPTNYILAGVLTILTLMVLPAFIYPAVIFRLPARWSWFPADRKFWRGRRACPKTESNG